MKPFKTTKIDYNCARHMQLKQHFTCVQALRLSARIIIAIIVVVEVIKTTPCRALLPTCEVVTKRFINSNTSQSSQAGLQRQQTILICSTEC